MITTQPLTQSLFDQRLLGSYGYVPIEWLSHRIFPISPSIRPPDPNMGMFDQIYRECDKIARIFYAILIVPALIPAALGLIYNFCYALLWPLPVEQEPRIDGSSFSSSETRVQEPPSIDPKLTDLLQDLKQLEHDFEELFADLSLLRGRSSGTEMGERFNLLAKELEPYKNNIYAKDYFNRLMTMKLQYEVLREERCALFYDPPRFHEQSCTVPVADNGNCLYISVVKGLDLYSLRDPLDPDQLDPEELRQQVIAWEKEHWQGDPELKKRITGVIHSILSDLRTKIAGTKLTIDILERDVKASNHEDERESIRQGIQNKQKELAQLEGLCTLYNNPVICIPYYLEQAAKPRIWGTEAELYAIAQMYQIGIYVKAVRRTEMKAGNEEPIIIDEDLPDFDVKDLFPERDRQLKLKNINGTHFEPLIENG